MSREKTATVQITLRVPEHIDQIIRQYSHELGLSVAGTISLMAHEYAVNHQEDCQFWRPEE